jgi:hypothetical protein
MRITSSDVSLTSQYQHVREDESSTSMRTWRERPAARAQAPPQPAHDAQRGRDDRNQRGDDQTDAASGDYRPTVMRMLVDRFSGERIDVLRSSDFQPPGDPVQMPAGSERFGAKTKNGFAELSRLDTDHDGWLDEDDVPYDELKLLQVAQDGTQSLRSVREAGVGAIHTGSVATPFELQGSDRTALGDVRSSGVYLREQGGAGVVQQLDLLA